MSEYSILRCDGCGEEIREGGCVPVAPPEGWARLWELDHCPDCARENEGE